MAGDKKSSQSSARAHPQRTIQSFFSSKPKSSAQVTPAAPPAKTELPKKKRGAAPERDGGRTFPDAPLAASGRPPQPKRVRATRGRGSLSSQESVPESPSCSRDKAPGEPAAAEAPGPAPGASGSPVRDNGRQGKAAVRPKPEAEEPGPFPDPQAAVGRRVRVYWPLDDAWYSGVIKQWKVGSKQHVVLYDDGAEEAVDLAQERFEWEEGRGGAGADHAKRGASSGKARARSPLQVPSAEDEEEEVVTFKKRPRGGQASAQSQGTGKAKGGRKGEGKAQGSQKRRRQACVSEDEDGEEEEADEASSGSSEDDEWKVNGDEEAEDEEESEEEVFEEASEEELEDDEEEGEEEGGTKKKGKGRGKAHSSPAAAKAKAPKGSTAARSAPKSHPSQAEAVAAQSPMPNGDAAGLRLRMMGNQQEAGSASAPSLKGGAPSRPSGLGVGLDFDLAGEAAERFSGRLDAKFDFLHRNRRDGQGRRPGQPGYDPTTVSLPAAFVKGLSEGQKQWWQFKAAHMDKVLLFKMGKFYEMFEMDAHIGTRELDLQYMKGEQPHCGFPEKNYSDNAERLARKGYRVLVVEQVETPEMLEQRKKATGAKDKVVRREVCALLTKGTLTDGDMVGSCPDPSYLLSVWESPAGACQQGQQQRGAATCGGNGLEPSEGEAEAAGEHASESTLGVCVADAATGQILLGQVRDDSARTALRTLLAELRPVELLLPAQGEGLSAATERALREGCRQPLVSRLPARAFRPAADVPSQLRSDYFQGDASEETAVEGGGQQASGATPWALQVFEDAGSAGGEAALVALGALVAYLKAAILDRQVLGRRRMEILPGWDPRSLSATQGTVQGGGGTTGGGAGEGGPAEEGVQSQETAFMLLDCTALENVEILENSRDGGTSGTLLAQLDHCVTPSGRKLLRRWLVRPLLSGADIRARQDAVEDIKTVALDAMGTARQALTGLPDMERLLARTGAASSKTSHGRNAGHVVLYEDMGLSRVREFTAALRGCSALLEAVSAFLPCAAQLRSSRLKRILPMAGGAFPSLELLQGEMSFLKDAFDWAGAEGSGRITPSGAGVDPAYDAALARISALEDALQEHLQEQRQRLKCPPGMGYANVGKDPYQLEVPEGLHQKVPSSWELKSSRKGFKRYWTPEIREHVEALGEAQQEREEALKGIYHRLLQRFCARLSDWERALACVAELDALGSLAHFALSSPAPMCRPVLLPEGGPPALRARALRHAVLSGLGGAFVPNDTELGASGEEGGQEPLFLLLTGPNMGGKSTLLRQLCLAIVLAQVGAEVPAESFALTPVDRLFVRMGARDHIMAAQSTFLVELAETASMLRQATRNSFVALDELGRGTSTADGQAIAHAVLQHMAHTIGCRGMFSTHYHSLAEEHATDPQVALKHMACHVGAPRGAASQGHSGEKGPAAPGTEEVVFLYKLAEGACPKSYGVNVARLAGMPESILEAAARRSEALEADRAGAAGAAAASPGERRGDADGTSEVDEGVLRDVLARLAQGSRGSDGLSSLVALQHQVAAASL